MSCAAEAVARGNTMMRGSQPPQQPPPRPPTTAAAAPTPHSNPATTLTNRRSSPFSIPAPSHTQTAIATAVEDVDCSGASHAGTKRKAEHQDNERLSKRLSLLNLERNGSKLYVPVENPVSNASDSAGVAAHGGSGTSQPPPGQQLGCTGEDHDDEVMQLDDSKHKVYIYNIDDELSSEDETTHDNDGRLVFLPDIEKHLQARRIPPPILPNSDGELAGMQMVLYSDPKSISVSEDKDGVRRAIIESRHRLREKQKQEREGTTPSSAPPLGVGNVPAADMGDVGGDDAMDID